jgi:hypothetical protein
MNSVHTPGPWTLERVPIESRGGSNTAWKIGPFCACLYDDWRNRENGIGEAEAEANARLIAAAPELLEACKAILTLEELEMGDDSLLPPEHPKAMVYAAIAKATGGTQ